MYCDMDEIPNAYNIRATCLGLRKISISVMRNSLLIKCYNSKIDSNVTEQSSLSWFRRKYHCEKMAVFHSILI